VRWTSLIGAGLSLRVARRAAHLSDSKWWGANSRRVQHAQLRRLLRLSAATEIGREARFGRIAGLPDEEMARAFRIALPTGEYERFRAPLARMREDARPDVLWPGVVRDWAQTSGTTGGEKYIPVSKEMMRSNFQAAIDIFAHAQRMGVSLPRLLGGRLLFLGGSTTVDTNRHGVRTGDLSGLVTPLIRWPLSEVYSPGPDVALMSHWPSKIDAMARLTLDQDIRFVSGMASWSLVLFQRVLELARERDPSVRCLRDVWPEFTLFVHGGVKYAPFDPRVREVWSGDPTGDIPFRLEVYPASEGFIAVQDTRHDPGLRLHTDIGVYYEFVPLEEIGRGDARAFDCGRVEPGQRYVVVMTTCAGLWRYIIGDVVEFDSVPRGRGGGPARLRIVGRHRHFINAFGENLIVEDIERAVVAARDASGATIGEFTAAPVYPAPGRSAGLELAVEWVGPLPGAPEVARFAKAFDRRLREVSVDYNTKRTGDLGMGEPKVTPLPTGTFHRWMESTGKLGGQHKTPRCANHRGILESVIGAATGVG